MYGYHGRYLRFDLTTATGTYVSLSDDVLRRFIGGVGLGAHLLMQETPAGVDPLSDEAALVFCLSPLVGTPFTTSAKFAVVAKSPLTNRLNDALSSSHFALAAKRAGIDALVVVGSCRAPSILVIEDEQTHIEPCPKLWGQSAQDANNDLRSTLGKQFQTAAIGIAGENLVRYATISHENRHAGRGGLGAVMGAKQLKAIAVAGTQRLDLADADRMGEFAKDLSRQSMGPATAKYRELGTVANLLTFNRLAALPTRNFQQGRFELAEQLSGESLIQTRRQTRHSCAACTIGCEHIFQTGDNGVRLEYESLFALGPLCGVGDKDVVLEAARLCDHFGLDTISTGATIAFAMECCERRLLPDIDLRFGDGKALLATIRDIAMRRNVGDLLADGTRLAAQAIGGDAPDFAPHVKGLEIPGYEPRSLQTMALGFAVGARGADHNRSGAYEADFSSDVDRLRGDRKSVKAAVATEDRAAIMDSVILCKFLRGVFDDFYESAAEMLTLTTGVPFTASELRQTASRIVTQKKRYNLREGWNAAEDTLPKRFLTDAIDGNDGPTVLPRGRLKAMIAAYYKERGWDEQGRPIS